MCLALLFFLCFWSAGCFSQNLGALPGRSQWEAKGFLILVPWASSRQNSDIDKASSIRRRGPVCCHHIQDGMQDLRPSVPGPPYQGTGGSTVDLENEPAVILAAKWVYSGMAEELQFGTCRLWPKHRQVQRTKERNVNLLSKEGIGKAASSESPLEESKHSGW